VVGAIKLHTSSLLILLIIIIIIITYARKRKGKVEHKTMLNDGWGYMTITHPFYNIALVSFVQVKNWKSFE
jgi:hypothetical protein